MRGGRGGGETESGRAGERGIVVFVCYTTIDGLSSVWKPDYYFYMCQCNCSFDNITLLHQAICWVRGLGIYVLLYHVQVQGPSDRLVLGGGRAYETTNKWTCITLDA